jgi:hypothetical protein
MNRLKVRFAKKVKIKKIKEKKPFRLGSRRKYRAELIHALT